MTAQLDPDRWFADALVELGVDVDGALADTREDARLEQWCERDELDDDAADDAGEIAIAYLTPERFAARPQVGIEIRQDWPSLVRWLTTPIYAIDTEAFSVRSAEMLKRIAGAWCPAALEGGTVRGGRGPISLLVADVDDCTEGAIERSAACLAAYAGALIPTYNATRTKPKHRIVLRLSRPLSADEFPIAWIKMATDLATAGITVDAACKNVNRLYFACVARCPEAWLGAIILDGEPVGVEAMLTVARTEMEEAAERARHRPAPRPVLEEHRDRYIQAAIESARGNIAHAGEGGRHDALLREAHSLARFDDLSELEIEGALLETFVAAAGEARRREGVRVIRDAFRHRRAS